MDKPKIYLLVGVHEEGVKPKSLDGILKSRAKHMGLLGLLVINIFKSESDMARLEF